MSNEDVKAKLVERLLYIQKQIDFRQKNLQDPILHAHYGGYLEATDGLFGERQFLEKLIEELG